MQADVMTGRTDAHMELLSEEMTLKPSRLRWLFVFLIGAGFVAGIAWLGPEKDPLLFWGGGGFFLLVAIVALPPVLGHGGDLTLDREGFTCRTLFRSFRRRWAECSAFYPVGVGARKFVGFSAQRDEAAHPNLAAANHSMIGASGMLPDTYGLSADKLADLMNRYRARSLGGLD